MCLLFYELSNQLTFNNCPLINKAAVPLNPRLYFMNPIRFGFLRAFIDNRETAELMPALCATTRCYYL
jgi:hypothetical protein